MTKRYITIALLLASAVVSAFAAEGKSPTVDQILDGIEKLYAGKGFTADFFQESMLKAMQITDTAEGRLIVKRPDKMRWEYSTPDTQTIITDGISMWIYRPADKQVMAGPAPEFFGRGKGAGFLSDIRQIRKGFRVELPEAGGSDAIRLRLTPLKPMAELSQVILSVTRADFRIAEVITFNSYGDETHIALSNYKFNVDPDDAKFTFHVPPGVEVIPINNP